jgi:hypothetical protein
MQCPLRGIRDPREVVQTCLVGQISKWLSSPVCKNIFVFF